MTLLHQDPEMTELSVESAHRNMLMRTFTKEFPENRVPEGPGIRRYRIHVANELRQQLQQLFEWIIGQRAAKWSAASEWWFQLQASIFDYRGEFARFMFKNIDSGFFSKEMVERWMLIAGPTT